MLTDKLRDYRAEEVNTVERFFVPCGSADVEMVKQQALAVAAGSALPIRSLYRPDASWRLFDRSRLKQPRPGLVVEVCSKQGKRDAIKKQKFYFASTNAEVRCVIIVDFTGKSLKATVSVCVADYDEPSGTGGPTISAIWLKEDEV